MSKNSFKTDRLIVSIIDNLSSAVNYILVRKKLRGESVFPKSDPEDYIQLADISNVIGGNEEIIPFDFNVAPVSSIDMTINNREDFGNNPHLEIWVTDLDSNGTGTEYLYPPPYTVLKQKSNGQLASIDLPDLNFDFTPTKKGYILLYI